MSDPKSQHDLGEWPIPPPVTIDVARRALILSAVVCRAHLERSEDDKGRRQTAEYIREWFDELDLWPHLEPQEERIIAAEFGKLGRRDRIAATWYVEGLALLAWALQRGPFPAHEDKVDAIAVTNSLEFLSPDAEDILKKPNLRPPAEIQAAREWFYDLHCSLRLFLGGSREGGHLARWIGEYLKVLKINPKTVMKGSRLLFRGERVDVAERADLEDWELVVCERHRASIWLAGDEDPYTELAVDT